MANSKHFDEKEIEYFLRSGEYPEGYTKERKRAIRRAAARFTVQGEEGLFLAKGGQVVVSSVEERRQCLTLLHNCGVGGRATLL